uniref:Putative secreted peptide n=1 Tax=Anopheles braziliensis TaxID=58242 RepID=A0A2M3ZQ13_9DIPT
MWPPSLPPLAPLLPPLPTLPLLLPLLMLATGRGLSGDDTGTLDRLIPATFSRFLSCSQVSDVSSSSPVVAAVAAVTTDTGVVVVMLPVTPAAEDVVEAGDEPEIGCSCCCWCW